MSNVLQIMLLDFGASRAYSRKFTDVYIQIIKAAAEGNRQGVAECSRTLGFLTGYETKVSSYFWCFPLISLTLYEWIMHLCCLWYISYLLCVCAKSECTSTVFFVMLNLRVLFHYIHILLLCWKQLSCQKCEMRGNCLNEALFSNRYAPCLEKSSQLWFAISLTHMNRFWQFLAEILLSKKSEDALISHLTWLVPIPREHRNTNCFNSILQSVTAWFFSPVDFRFILMLLYDFIDFVISGVQLWAVG